MHFTFLLHTRLEPNPSICIGAAPLAVAAREQIATIEVVVNIEAVTSRLVLETFAKLCAHLGTGRPIAFDDVPFAEIVDLPETV